MMWFLANQHRRIEGYLLGLASSQVQKLASAGSSAVTLLSKWSFARTSKAPSRYFRASTSQCDKKKD